MEEYYLSVILTAVAAALTCFTALPMLKIIQLSGYRARGVVAWWKDSACDVLVRYAALTVFAFITVIIYVGCFGSFAYARYAATALYSVLAIVFIASAGKSGANGVKFTGRAVRLFIVNAVLTLGLGVLVAWANYYSTYCQTLVAGLAILAPFVAVAANAVTCPFEKLNNLRYVKRAKKKLAEKGPIVIGITGSFGKTTAKNMLAAMLGGKYGVLATPGSYNTPMGICKTINDKRGDEEVFIAEMGARYKGDIKELCDIVSPKYGMITAIGDMHIRTLKNRAGVADTKYELGAALPNDGLLVLNGYNPDCAALASRDSRCEKRVTGNSRAAFRDVKLGADGTRFVLALDGNDVEITASMLGGHIAELACACAEIALELGVSAQDIAAAIRTMQPVPHRLELVPTEGSRVVIDDGYNSNPVGAKNAVDVLACFEGKKVIITPGFVELGGIEKQCNAELGRQIADVCDYAFLVGAKSGDIKKGAVKADMNEDRIYECKTRDEAVAVMNENIADGDLVILFENDVPVVG